jgi:hypothetical protein
MLEIQSDGLKVNGVRQGGIFLGALRVLPRAALLPVTV